MFDRGIIVSCQPRRDGCFVDDAWKFVGEACHGGAVAVRVEGERNISKAHKISKVPIIGLIKVQIKGATWITPSFADAFTCTTNGASYVAADATFRNGDEEIGKMVASGAQVIGDVATIDQAKRAADLGCVAVTTALSGYTEDYRIRSMYEPPDIDLIDDCVKCLKIPVIAEGRYYTLEDVQTAIWSGAHSVCMGAAITIPHLMTQYFSRRFQRNEKN